MKIFKRALLWAALLALALVPCAAGETVVTVNEVTHSVFYAPLYAAIELGMFAEEGLKIDLVNGGGSDKSMTAVLSGHADIGLMGPETAVYVFNQGKADHAVIIGQLTKCDGSFLVGRAPEEDFSFDTLRGKTIIGGRRGGMPVMTLEYVLRQKGLTPGVDVFVRTDIQFNLMAGAFEGSGAEYVTLFEPTASLTEREGKGYIVASVGQESGDIPYTAFMVKKSALEKDPELYAKFLRAVTRAQEWVHTHSAEEIAAAIAPQFPDSDLPLLTKVCENHLRIDAWKKDPRMLEQDYNLLLDVIESAGELTARPPFEKLIDFRLTGG